MEYLNFSKSEIYGLDFNLTVKPVKGLKIRTGYSLLKAMGKKEDQDSYTHIDGTGDYSLNFSTNYTLKLSKINSLNFNVLGKAESRRYYSDETADKYNIWDFTLTHNLITKKYGVDLSIGLKNIFDKVDSKPYGSHYSTIDPGRRIFAKLIIKLNK